MSTPSTPQAISPYTEKKTNKFVDLRENCSTPCFKRGPGSSVGIATELRAGRSGIESRWGRDFPPRPDRSWGPPSLLYNGYRVFPGGKVRPERAADHSPPSSAAVMEE